MAPRALLLQIYSIKQKISKETACVLYAITTVAL